MPKPDKYPLPWCDALGRPYWQVNILLCASVEGWTERQSRRDMREIIPWIDDLIASGALRREVATEGRSQS